MDMDSTGAKRECWVEGESEETKRIIFLVLTWEIRQIGCVLKKESYILDNSFYGHKLN